MSLPTGRPEGNLRAAIETAPEDAAWRTEALFFEATAFYEDLLDSIGTARQRIRIETYIFDADSLGWRFIEALQAAAARGVDVRVLMDGAGTYEHGDTTAAALEQAGITIKIFRPLPWQIHHYHRAIRRGTRVNQFLHLVSRINQRDHRKLYLIDNETLWSGSFNISANHLPSSQGGAGWHDYGVKVSGSNVMAIARQFDDYWERRPPALGEGLFRNYWNIFSEFSRIRRNQLLLEKIQSARQRIWLVAAYFAPAASVVRALKAADQRGVDVKIVVAGKSDVPFFPLLTSTYYADLLKAGVEIYEYSDNVLHAKALLIDNFCLVGSTNFNHRSYLHDLELDIVLQQPASIRTLEAQMILDRNQSLPVGSNIPHQRRWRWLGWLPRLLRYWM